MDNPLIKVQKLGQSIWYDNIRRGLITSGELQSMVDHDGLLGVTSNPAIFEKALGLAIEDIQLAADVMYPVYARTGGRDGFVSFEDERACRGDQQPHPMGEANGLWLSQPRELPQRDLLPPEWPRSLPRNPQINPHESVKRQNPYALPYEDAFAAGPAHPPSA